MPTLCRRLTYRLLMLVPVLCLGCERKPASTVENVSSESTTKSESPEESRAKPPEPANASATSEPERAESTEVIDSGASSPSKETASEPKEKKDYLKKLRPMARSGVSRYSPDGNWFVIGSDDLRVFDLSRRECVDVIPVSGYRLVALDFSADGSKLATGYWTFDPQEDPEDRGFEIVILSFPQGKELTRFAGLPGHTNSRRRLAFSPDGKLLADGYAKTVQVRDVESGEVTWEITDADLEVAGHSYASFDVTPDWKYFLVNLQRVAYPSKETIPMVKFADESRPFFWQNLISADGKLAVAMGGPNGSIQKLFELESGNMIQEVNEVPSRSITASPDFSRFVNAQGYWEAESGAKHKLPGNAGSMAFTQWTSVSPDGKEATVGGSHFAFDEVRQAATEKRVQHWGETAFISRPLDVAFNDLGMPLVQAMSKQRSIDLESGAIGPIEPAPRRSIFGDDSTKFGTFPRATSPNKNHTCDASGWLKDLRNESKRYLFESDDPATRPKSGQPFFPDDQTLVFFGGGKLFVFNTAGEPQRTMEFPGKGETASIVGSADGRILVVSQGSWRTGHRRYVSVLNIAEGKTIIPAVELGTCRIDISHDGTYVAAIGTKWVKIFGTNPGELLHELRLSSGNAVKSRMDLRRPVLYVSTDNATVELIDMKTGKGLGIVAARGDSSLADNMAFIRGMRVRVAGDRNKLFGAD